MFSVAQPGGSPQKQHHSGGGHTHNYSGQYSCLFKYIFCYFSCSSIVLPSFPPSFPSLRSSLLSRQTLSEDIRMTSALLTASKKVPVLTPPTLSISCGMHVLLSHWSLAVSLRYLYTGPGLSPGAIDRALTAAGYTRGPFQAMKMVSGWEKREEWMEELWGRKGEKDRGNKDCCISVMCRD